MSNTTETKQGLGHQVTAGSRALSDVVNTLQAAYSDLKQLGIGSDALAALNHINLAMEEVSSLAYSADEALNQDV